MSLFSRLLLSSLLLFLSTHCDEVKISSPEGFVELSNNVSKGTNYKGATVLLDADLDMSGMPFEPIGKSSSFSFQGTFDGQGHTISNLVIDSSSEYVGLIGYSKGLFIKNVVIDDTCSVKSSFSSGSTNACLGGVIGYCEANFRGCIIEAIINMASVSYTGILHNDYGSSVGGIIDNINSNVYDSFVKNCANYGTISHSGESAEAYIGGIVSYSRSDVIKHIQNCINYGAITFSGLIGYDLYIGGIVSSSLNTSIENCVSVGVISVPDSLTTAYKGSIVGDVGTQTYIKYCHWMSNIGADEMYEGETPVSTTGTTSSTIGSDLIASLNDQSSINGWNKWIFNENNKIIAFKVNNNKEFSLSSQLILLPDLAANSSNVFSGWYTDNGLKEYFDSATISNDITLYSRYSLYIEVVSVTLDGNGGTSLKEFIEVSNGSPYGELPTANREGYTFVGWYTERSGGNKIESNTKLSTTSGHTLYAHWDINNYTLTFIFDNGSEHEVRILNYSQKINYPADPEREGYTFDKWDVEINEMSANDTTITALWTINNYTLTFIFDNGSEHEIRILNYSQKIEYPADPEKEGYTFDGWDNKPVAMPADSLTVIALWTANNYTVTFNATGGDVTPLSKEVTYNSIYGELPIPTKTDCGFSGWFTEENGKGDKIIKNTIVKITNNQTLYANWTAGAVTVTFNATGGISSQASKYVVCNSEYGELPTAEKEGHTFAGWFTEEESGTKIESTTRVINAEHHTLYAHWDINNYTLKFIFDNGSESEVRILNYSQEIEYPADPKKTGYTFSGWDVKLVTMPTNDITITALWTINNYTLTFIFGNGTEPEVRILNYSQEIEYPTNPEKEGYTFDKWDNKLDAMTANDTTITALWTANNYRVTFNPTGGDVTPSSKEVTYGCPYDELPTPTKTGYTFIGWFTKNNELITSDIKVNITNNHVLVAQWKETPSNKVEIVFGVKDLTENEIKDIIREYTNADFTIINFEGDYSEGIRVIIKFDDVESAEEFTEKVPTSSESKIKKVSFIFSDKGSYAINIQPIFSLMTIYIKNLINTNK